MRTLSTDDPALAALADASGRDRVGPDFERRARARLDHWRTRDDAELQRATEALRACTAS